MSAWLSSFSEEGARGTSIKILLVFRTGPERTHTLLHQLGLLRVADAEIVVHERTNERTTGPPEGHTFGLSVWNIPFSGLSPSLQEFWSERKLDQEKKQEAEETSKLGRKKNNLCFLPALSPRRLHSASVPSSSASWLTREYSTWFEAMLTPYLSSFSENSRICAVSFHGGRRKTTIRI